ncbi:MAG: ATP-binding protein [Patescibacteria group bacterium]
MSIKRSILPELEKHLEQPEMTFLIGPRQVGKTYLMRQMRETLQVRGEKTVFLNLDIDEDSKFFVSQSVLINYIKLQVGNSRAYIFVDEIQRKVDAGLFLKGIYDMNLPYKFILSGSGSLDLKARIKESMAGRKQIFEIEPINFEEFVNFRTNYQYEDRLESFFDIEKNKTKHFFEEYLMYGGYPRIVLAETVDKKKTEIEEIYRSYIEKDITLLLKVEKPDAFTNLLKVLASQIGSLVNVNELSATIGISNKTIQHYLWYLEETFVIKKVTPFYRNIRSEITKAPIYYFVDLGLRNYLLGLFGLPLIPNELVGHLFENAIFSMLRLVNDIPVNGIHFWRTKDNAEVDFVINTGTGVIPLEVKYTELKQPGTTRSFKSFLGKYKPSKAYIVHLGSDMADVLNETEVLFIPYYKVSSNKFLP